MDSLKALTTKKTLEKIRQNLCLSYPLNFFTTIMSNSLLGYFPILIKSIAFMFPQEVIATSKNRQPIRV